MVSRVSGMLKLQLIHKCNRTLRRGKHRLLLWPGKEADGSIESTTPSKLESRDEMGRLEKVSQINLSAKNEKVPKPL